MWMEEKAGYRSSGQDQIRTASSRAAWFFAPPWGLPKTDQCRRARKNCSKLKDDVSWTMRFSRTPLHYKRLASVVKTLKITRWKIAKYSAFAQILHGVKLGIRERIEKAANIFHNNLMQAQNRRLFIYFGNPAWLEEAIILWKQYFCLWQVKQKYFRSCVRTGDNFWMFSNKPKLFRPCTVFSFDYNFWAECFLRNKSYRYPTIGIPQVLHIPRIGGNT